MLTPRRLLCMALAGAATLGCAPTPMTDKRRELLHSWGVDFVLPELQAVAEHGQELESKIVSMCADPSSGRLEEARAAWSKARAPWKRFEVFAFGPASERPLQLAPQIDFWPVRTASVDKALAEREYADGTLLATQKGFPALEYLLFGPAAAVLAQPRVMLDAGAPNTDAARPSVVALGDAAVAGDTTTSSDAAVPSDGGTAMGDASERCVYLQRMAEALVADAQRLHQAWDPKNDDYLSQLTRAGNESVEFDSLPMALGLVVSRMAQVVTVIRTDKLAVPFGPDAEHLELDKLESRFSERSVSDMLDNLDGVEAAYFGANAGLGLDDYMNHRGKSFASRFRALIERARAALRALDEPLPKALATKRSEVKVALQRLQELQHLIQVEFLGALSLSLQFTDNDGD